MVAAPLCAPLYDFQRYKQGLRKMDSKLNHVQLICFAKTASNIFSHFLLDSIKIISTLNLYSRILKIRKRNSENSISGIFQKIYFENLIFRLDLYLTRARCFLSWCSIQFFVNINLRPTFETRILAKLNSGGHSGHFVKKLLSSKNQETGDAFFVFKSM